MLGWSLEYRIHRQFDREVAIQIVYNYNNKMSR